MGSVSIKSHLGDAQYSVDVHFDNSPIEAKQAFIESRLTEIESQLTTLDGELTTKSGEIDAALAALNEYIETTSPQQIAADQSTINQLTKRCLELRADYDSLKRRQNWLKIEKTSLSKESDFLAKYCPSSIETNIWCIEYNEDLEGSSKSIEVDYAVIRDPLTDQIRTEGIWLPGETEPATDILRPPMAGSVHSTWFDVAIAPGAQAHKGRYRVATIDSLDTDNNKADITFDGRYSPSESLTNVLDTDAIHPMIDGGQQMSVSGCPVVYMTCDAQAFEVGDKVIVDLHGGAGLPTVIGFYSNPKQCAMFSIYADENYPYFYHNDNPGFEFHRHSWQFKFSTAADFITNSAAYAFEIDGVNWPFVANPGNPNILKRWESSADKRLTLFDDGYGYLQVDGGTSLFPPFSFVIKKDGNIVAEATLDMTSRNTADLYPAYTTITNTVGAWFGKNNSAANAWLVTINRA